MHRISRLAEQLATATSPSAVYIFPPSRDIYFFLIFEASSYAPLLSQYPPCPDHMFLSDFILLCVSVVCRWSQAVSVGSKVPAVSLDLGFPPEKVDLAARLKGKKTILIGLPGAFTPT